MYKIIDKKEKTIKNLGGKGFNLLKLDKLGLTPNFAIVSSSVFRNYLEKDLLLLKHLNNNILTEINFKFVKKRILNFKPNRNLLLKINSAINQLGINKTIIRSSFVSEDSKNLSYAGLFDSYVCYKKDDIFIYIKKVWASQFNERVLNYQKEKNDFKLGMAVIIQDFIKPDFSGVVFLQQSKYQEIFIEYCEKSYQAVELGTKKPFVCLLRDDFLYLNSSISKSHTEWIQNLIDQLLQYKNKNNISFDIDIEFAILENKVYLLQARPLTKKINAEGQFFIYEREKRWNYHLDDFSVKKFKRILNKLNIKIPIKIEKKENGIFIESNSYFSFIDEIKKKSINLKFLNDFYKYYLNFILFEYKKTKKISKELVLLIFTVKKLNFKMSLIDFIHGLLIKNLKEFLIKKHNITESKNLEYFVPPISFGTYNFLLSNSNEGKFIKQHNRNFLDKCNLNMLINNIKTNQKKVFKIFNKFKGRQKEYFLIVKKLIWLRDVVDYYYSATTSLYENNLSLILKNESIKYSFKDILKICKFSMDEIQEVRKNKFCPRPYFLIKKKQKDIGQKKYIFPLKGIIASKGNFRGIVKVIKNFFDIKKITSKDILVSECTSPSLVIGMAVCKGIITEEGGLTSHAAIVSRELGKPCVINVQGCVDVLKDGNKIKVINGKIYKLK